MQSQDHGVPFLHLSNLLEDVRKHKQLALQDGQVLRRFQEAQTGVQITTQGQLQRMVSLGVSTRSPALMLPSLWCSRCSARPPAPT